ncbi:MAG: hypothetical protein IPM21_05040 [Acidobacteria bacterium]|nr:hypothetical protein [Acidobacteriota bacterium]
MLTTMRLFLFLLAASPAALAQLPTPTPTPPGSGNRPISPVLEDNTRFDRLRSIDLINERQRSGPSHPLLDSKRGIYRTPDEKETKLLAVDASLLTEHEPFLKQRNTGIVKLNADSECVSSVEVLNATEKCLDVNFPGAGIAFSFRTESYRLPRLADLIFLEGFFRADAVLQQVVMVELGDVPLGDVTLQTSGMRYLAELKPPPDGEQFMAFDRQLAAGINDGGFSYRKGFRSRADITYALRSIAYKGTYMRSIDGVTYDELDYDKRRDVIVAFRVVDTDKDGNVTLLWKRLRETNAPTLKIKK